MKIFLSYAQADAKTARKLREALVGKGYKVWSAEEDLAVGSNWYSEIGRRLKGSDAIIVLLSPDTMKSDWVRSDIEHALTTAKFEGRLISILVEPTTDFPWILERLQFIDATKNKDQVVRRVVAALRKAPVAA